MLCRGTVLVLAALACHRGVLADVPVSPGAIQCLSVAINRCGRTHRSPSTVTSVNALDLPVAAAVSIAAPLHLAGGTLQIATHACHCLRQ